MSALVAVALVGVALIVTGLEDALGRVETAAFKDGTRRTARRIAVVGVAVIAGGVALLVAVALSSAVAAAALSVVLLPFLHWRGRYLLGSDGADRMLSVVLLLGVIGTVASFADPVVVSLWGWTVVVVVGAAYAESAVAKMRVPSWRRGRALALIMNTPELGERRSARLLLNHPRVTFVVSWGVIIVEAAALPVFIVGGWPLFTIVGCLLVLHVGIAVSMGLGRFFWAFAAALALVIAAHPGL